MNIAIIAIIALLLHAAAGEVRRALGDERGRLLSVMSSLTLTAIAALVAIEMSVGLASA